MDIKGKIESYKASIGEVVDTYKPLLGDLTKGIQAVLDESKSLQEVVDAGKVIGEAYGIMGEATEILSECKEAGLTLDRAGTLDDAVKRGIIDRYNDFYGQNNPAFEKNISAAMVGGLLYMIIHREALDAQEYHRTNMCSACTGCEGGAGADDISGEGSACEPQKDADQ